MMQNIIYLVPEMLQINNDILEIMQKLHLPEIEKSILTAGYRRKMQDLYLKDFRSFWI